MLHRAKPEWESYDPSASLARQQQESDQTEAVDRLRADLDEAHREAVEQASSQPPPATVRAYRAVYGHFPTGWPPQLDG